MKKIITGSISILSAAFVSILSIKTSISSRADILGIRSIRFVINSVVPVIGSTISEGLLSIQSYSSLIKSSVGIVGIIAIALVFLPSIIEVMLWRFMLSVCLIISGVFGDNSVTLVLKAFKDTMLLVNVVLVLSMMTSVVSFGILIAAKSA
jgi:stage III sporulation protein AE